MRHLRLFKVRLPIEGSSKGGVIPPFYLIVEAVDYGDAQMRASMFDNRVPERIEDITDTTTLVTHFDVIEAQSRAEQIEAQSREDEREERAF